MITSILALHAARSTGQAISCGVPTVSSLVKDGAVSERACLPPRANLNPDVRYFKVTVPAPGADMVYTSLISPNNSTCSGKDGSHICTAPFDTIVTYKTFTGQFCLPDENNNNWVDLSARFSKSIVICKPCPAGDYWLGLRHHTPGMPCDLKLFTPKMTAPNSQVACTFDPLPADSMILQTDTCGAGLVREKPVGCPFEHTCLLGTCWNKCYFGYCQDYFFLGAAALAGLLLASLLSCCILLLCRRRWKRKLQLAEDNIREMVSKPYNLTVVDDDGADSDKDEEIPDLLPPTFFVRDRDD